jgi:hypothetical protein
LALQPVDDECWRLVTDVPRGTSVAIEFGKLLGDRVEALDREGVVVVVVADEDFRFSPTSP